MNRPYIKYTAALLLFGTNGIVASHIALPSVYIVLYRTLLGSALLLALYLRKGNPLSFQKHKKDLAFVSISGIAMGASWMLLYEAYAQIGVSIASLLYYCGPVIVMMLSPFIFKEKPTLPKILGFLAVLCGIFFVNDPSADKLSLSGLLLGLLSAVMYSVMVIANKKAKAIVGMENAAIQLVVSFLTVAAFVVFRYGAAFAGMEAGDVLWILLLGFVNTGIGCYLYFSSIGLLPVQSVAILGYLEPLSAVLLSVFLLGEQMRPLQILGAVLMIGGAVLAECWTFLARKILISVPSLN